MGGVAPTPIRIAQAEAVLIGLPLDEAMAKISDCVQIAVQAACPIDDVRATASYRRDIVAAFLHQCAENVFTTLKKDELIKS